MSRLYFHTEHDAAELRGWERAHMVGLAAALAVGLVPWEPDRLEPYLTPASPLRHWLHAGRSQVLPRWISTYLSVGDDPTFQDHDGAELDSFSLVLNTALVVGSDPVCLMARLHAQCEIHCYIEGQNRAWIAGLIRHGRAARVMRAAAGWEQVGALLCSADDGPVVCSYSVTDQFPNSDVADWLPSVQPALDDYRREEKISDQWAALPRSEQWRLGMVGLRGRPASHLLELRPDTLRAPIGHGRSLIDLFHGPPGAAHPARRIGS